MVFRELSRFEVSRPVLSGAGDVMTLARHHGRAIFGEDTSNAIAVPSSVVQTRAIDGEVLGMTQALIARGEPRLHLYSKLMLHLLQVAGPSVRYYSDFAFAAQRLDGGSRNRKSPDEEDQYKLTISRDIERHDLRYGEANQDEIIVHCQGLTYRDAPQGGGLELVLLPDPAEDSTEMFIGEHRICVSALEEIARTKKNFIHVHHEFMPSIPFAQLPADATPLERSQIVGKLSEEPIWPLRLTLGSILPPAVH